MHRGGELHRSHPPTSAWPSDKSFTSKKADEDMVAGLYETTFTLRFAQAKELNYSSLNWGDAEAATFAKVVASGALDKLEVSWCPTAQKLSPCPETLHVLHSSRP